MSSSEILLQNIREFSTETAKSAESGSYNSAVTLLFKAVAADLFILGKEGFIPKNHTERFSILKSKYPSIYHILNKDFPVYRQSYRIKLNKEYVGVLENDLKRLIDIAKITL